MKGASAAIFLNEAGFFTQKVSLSGKRVISARKISFAYGDRPIIKDFSTTIMRNDKVAILGRNGCGKTTLIKLLLKELNPRKGIVEHGTKLTFSYIDQNRTGLEPKLSLIDNIMIVENHFSHNFNFSLISK